MTSFLKFFASLALCFMMMSWSTALTQQKSELIITYDDSFNVNRIGIQNGCTELSRTDLQIINQYDRVIIDIPDSYHDLYVLSCMLPAIWYSVEDSHPHFQSISGCLYSKDGKTLLLQPFSQKVDTLVIPEGTQAIDVAALQGKIRHISLPSTMRTCAEALTYNGYFAEIESVSVSPQNTAFCTKDDILYTKDMRTLLFYPPQKLMDNFSVPEGTVYINDSAFAYACISVLTLPNSLLHINEYAFWCSKIKRVEGGQHVVSIGSHAFEGSKLLYAVTCLENICHIGEMAFSDTRLTTVCLPETLNALPAQVFSECYHLCDVTILCMDICIAGDAFERIEPNRAQRKISIHCFPNSTAEAFARQNGYDIQFIKRE